MKPHQRTAPFDLIASEIVVSETVSITSEITEADLSGPDSPDPDSPDADFPLGSVPGSVTIPEQHSYLEQHHFEQSIVADNSMDLRSANVNSADQPHETHACNWEPHNRPHAHPQIFFRGVGYCSLSEAALAILLEYFIPGFDIVPGKTFQVPIGGGRSVDFCINGTLVEYHQLRMSPSRGRFGDFSSESEYREYKRIRQRVRGNSRKKSLLDSIVRQRLAGHYYRKRRAIIDRSAHFKSFELVVATSRAEFFEHVLEPFALVQTPSRQALESMFWQAVKQIAKAQPSKSAAK